MKKIVSIFAIVGSMLYSASANAQHYHRNSYYHRPIAPYVAGGAALGILGGAIIADEYYRPYCHRVLVEQQWNGYRWVPYYEKVCD